MVRPFVFSLKPDQAALIREVDGVFSIEPMRFMLPGAARARAKRLAAQERRRTGRVNVGRGQGVCRP